jgi:predicted NBD/HSP70 family sugar kinase
LYVGTGFGSAFVSEGKIIAGSNNQAGEIGHIPFRATNFTCACGRDDCVELSTSGQGLIRRLGSAEVLDEAFMAGLAHAFVTACTLFDPDTVVLGGGVIEHHFELLEYLKSQKLPFANGKKELKIIVSTLHEGSLKGTHYLQ